VNLYLRLLLTIFKALWAPRIKPGDSIELRLRVLPNDLDLNGHMNNGRYLGRLRPPPRRPCQGNPRSSNVVG